MTVTDPLAAAALKDKQRALRDGFPTPLALRVHRALSWLARAEAERDDARAARQPLRLRAVLAASQRRPRLRGLGRAPRQGAGHREPRAGGAGQPPRPLHPVRPALCAAQPVGAWRRDLEQRGYRAQVRDGGALLGCLLPVFIDLMMDHPDQIWPMPHYPVVA